MAGSILDFGEVARTIIGLGNLDETRRRNDLYEQNTLQEGQRIGLARQKMEQEKFTDLIKLADDPRIKANPDLSDKVLGAAWRVAKMPEIDSDAMRRGRERVKGLLMAMANGDKPTSEAALIDLQLTMGPDDTAKIQKALADNQKMLEWSQNAEAVRDLNAAKTEKIQTSLAKIDTGLVPFTTASHEFFTALTGTDTNEFKQAMKSYDKLKGKASEKQVGLLGGASLSRFTGTEMGTIATGADDAAQHYKSQAFHAWHNLQLLDRGGDLPKGITKRDLVEQQAVGEELGRAYSALATWARTPFDATALKHAKAASDVVEAHRKQLDGLKASTAEEIVALRQQALNFRMGEAEKKHLYESNVAKASAEALKAFGYTPTAEQLAATATKYGVKPQDLTVKDPSKQGKTTLELKMGQEDVSRNLKIIESAQMAQDYILEISDVIKANPSIVGRGAQLGTAFAGATQQLRAIVNLDPEASKFLNTKPRDTAEALHEVLVYAVAKTMDPTGALDIKVVQHARDTVGDIDTFTTGPQQMLNKLETVSGSLGRSIRRARRHLSGGIQSYLTDEPAAKKPVTEMSIQELMDAVTKGATD